MRNRKKKAISYFDRPRINDWLKEPKRIKGSLSQANVDYLRELKGLDQEFARVGVITYFLVARIGIGDARAMMYSADKQRGFIWTVNQDLKKYRLEGGWLETFKLDTKLMHNRVKQIYKICKLDLHETEHYPFFDAVGFEELLNIDYGRTWDEVEEKKNKAFEELLESMALWEADHADIIAKHMADTEAERERHRKFIERKEAMLKAEKEEAKAQKKAEREEIAEIKKNNKEWLKRKRKLDRELDTVIRNSGKLTAIE